MTKISGQEIREYAGQLMQRVTDFTPFATPELQAVVGAAAARLGRERAYWEGLLYGLALTLHPDPEVLPMVLEIEQESPEVRAQVAEYAAGLWARLDVEDSALFDVSVNPALVSNREQAEAFLRGVATVMQADPEPLKMLTSPMAAQVLGENVIQTVMLVMSFLQVSPDEPRARIPEWRELQDMRQGAMKPFEDADAESVALTVQLMLLNLDEFYGFATVMEQVGVHPKMLRGGLGAAAEPMRREGRKIRPNEPCPCGSGKKYKKCHGAPGAAPLP